MLLTITFGTASGESAHVEVDPEATPMDVLHALTDTKALGVDATNNRYVVSSTRLGRDLLPSEKLGDAGIRENDVLTVDTSETGYRPGRRRYGRRSEASQ
jgi:hypothetical protein